MFEVDENDVLFEIEGNKITNYNVQCFSNGFRVLWQGSKGLGSFTYTDNDNLDTEFMGEEFCSKFMKKIFNRCEVEYEEGENGEI